MALPNNPRPRGIRRTSESRPNKTILFKHSDLWSVRASTAPPIPIEMEPLVSKSQHARVLDYISSGREEGATVVCCGNSPPGAAGCYVRPTVLSDVNPGMRVVREEIFGPVLTVARFTDVEDVLRRANDTQIGLGASVWTQSLDRAHWFIYHFRAGTVWVNTHGVLDIGVPFGGTKQSGIGHELGEEAVHHHTQLKSVFMSLRAAP
jgi:phenylacetaldehyde dehydrogenase